MTGRELRATGARAIARAFRFMASRGLALGVWTLAGGWAWAHWLNPWVALLGPYAVAFWAAWAARGLWRAVAGLGGVQVGEHRAPRRRPFREPLRVRNDRMEVDCLDALRSPLRGRDRPG